MQDFLGPTLKSVQGHPR